MPAPDECDGGDLVGRACDVDMLRSRSRGVHNCCSRQNGPHSDKQVCLTKCLRAKQAFARGEPFKSRRLVRSACSQAAFP
eukprot:6200252-Pleurochrysis_carterae.AAC.3